MASMDKKVIRNMEREATYDILQNKEGELLFCVRTREGEPETPYIEYDGGANAVYYRTPAQVILLDEVHPDVREAFTTADKVLFAEFIPKSEEKSDNEKGVIREYMVEVRRVDKIPEFEVGESPVDSEPEDYTAGLFADDAPENAGERIRAMIATNLAEAQRVVDFYTTMADDGNVGAMYELGMLYWEGVGVAYDYGKARTWMERAAAQGDERALEFLADMLDDGGRYDGEV
jgi:hypothetical protein